MKKTYVINLIGGPGVGKSTTAAALFAKLKLLHLEVENIPEFAKELVWEENFNSFNDRLYMHAVQNHRMFSVNGKVDFMVVDSPLLLTSIYNQYYLKDKFTPEYHAMIDNVVEQTIDLYNNINYYIERSTDYMSNGRREDEKMASDIDSMIKAYLNDHHIEYQSVKLEDATDVIYQDLVERMKDLW